MYQWALTCSYVATARSNVWRWLFEATVVLATMVIVCRRNILRLTVE